jgi:hypothetical protein
MGCCCQKDRRNKGLENFVIHKRRTEQNFFFNPAKVL